MLTRRRLAGAAIAAGIISLLMAGCSQQTIESAGKDVARNTEIVEREAKRAERKARPQIAKGQLGLRVTTALKANQKLPGSIRVDAGEDGVKLRGTVKTQEQKELAERVARDTLSEEYTVTNDLKVEGEE